jgi:hypothetical protein
MLARGVVFILTALIGVTLPWYIVVAALAAAVVLYRVPVEFIMLGFFLDIYYSSNLRSSHYLVITSVLLIIYIVTVIVRDRLRFI